MNIDILNEVCIANGSRIIITYNNYDVNKFKKAFVYERWVGSRLKVLLFLFRSNTIKSFLKIIFLTKFAGFYIDKDIVLKYSLNGMLVLDYLQSTSMKIIDSTYEEAFLFNENTSKKLYPSLCLKEMSNGVYKNYFIYKNKLIKYNCGYIVENWQIIENAIYSKLLNPKQNNLNFNIISIGDYLKRIDIEIETLISGGYIYFQKNINSINNMYQFVLGLLSSSNILHQPTIIKFSHGDVMPSNVLIKEGEPLLIDWANGGYLNFLYDYSIKYIYDPELYIRTNFSRLMSIEDTQINHFLKFYSDITNAKIDDINLKINIFISAMEFAIKNFKRHQNIDSIQDGEEVLSLVESCISNIISTLYAKH